jgi:ribose 5-phosphate isomerase B
MRIAVGSDEVTGLTDRLVAALREGGHEVELHGPLAGGEEEWAEVSAEVAARVAGGGCERGVVMCWSGTGASIAANKVPGARAALCADAETARMARKYNHANVLALSLRATSETLGLEIIEAFLDEPEGPDDFDRRNVARLARLEAGGTPPAA